MEQEKIVIITSKNCPICRRLPKNGKDIIYLDINSVEAKKYDIDAVPSVFVGTKQCALMRDTKTKEIFISCPDED